ncbi:MAG: phosphoglycolate phosphatase [Alphaproteobacteria bacterium]|nr:phosphoglycolate phosphatase [Alphaproteobacteria bacterium]
MTIRYVILDLDGTLIDSAPDLRAAANTVLAEAGRPPLDLPTIRRFIGDGVRVLVERAFAATGPAIAGPALDEATARYVALYEAAATVLTRPYDGVPETLARLRGAGLTLAVCTNKPVAAAGIVLRDLGLAPLIDAVSGGDSVARRKPDPEHVRDALRRLGGSAEAAAMVGDAEPDIAAGKAAGLKTVAVTYGYCKVAHAALGADVLIDRFGDLDAALRRL